MKTISRAEFVALVAALTTINAASIDVMLPALPNLGAAFAVANPNDRSLVLTAFLLGMGLPQLVFGPISDRFGRRGPLLGGLAVFTVAALAALVAPSFAILLALRFLQGAGSAAVMVSIQSAVRDRYSGEAMAEVISVSLSLLMIVPIVAPSVGQLLLFSGHWQLIFVFMGALGVIFAGWAFVRLPESLMAERRRAISPRVVAAGFLTVVRNRSSFFYALSGAFMFGSILSFVNMAQQIYVDIYHLGALFPIAFAATPLTFALAFLLNSRFVRLIGMRRLAHGAMVVLVTATTVWLVLALTVGLPLWLFVTMLMLAGLAQGFAWGNIGALAMEPVGQIAGTAAAVFGSLQTVGAALLGYLVAQRFDGTTMPLVTAFFVFSLSSGTCFLAAERGKLFGARDPAPIP